MKKLFLFSILVLALIASACSPTSSPAQTGEVVSVDGGSYRNVTPAALHDMLSHKDFTMVNVHIPFEGNIANTDLSLAYDTIGQNLNQLPADKNAKIVLYCRSGRMSDIAARVLVKQGYTNIWNLAGGMAAWEQAGFKIDR